MRKRKNQSQKRRDKAEKQEEKRYQDMAIGGIANREKREEVKGKTPKESSDTIPKTTISNEQYPREVKTVGNTEGGTMFTDVFDSSECDSMAKMKKSGGTQKEEPAELAITDIQTSNVDKDSPPTTVTAADTSQPNLEEKAAILRGSKPEQIFDISSTDKKDGIHKEKEEAEKLLSHSLINPYTTFWRELTRSCTDLYVGSARNITEITGYWLDLFSKPWSVGRKTKERTKVE
jgi:hypothetical protein